MNKPTAGELIRAERKKKGLSISKLAELTEVSQPYLSQIENGKRNPSYEIIKKITKVLNIDFYLLSWASGLYSDVEYSTYRKREDFFDSLSPEEMDAYINRQEEDFTFIEKVNKFKNKKYVKIENFLNNSTEYFYINDHKLTKEEIKMLIHLFEGKEKNYPTDSEIENKFTLIRQERLEKLKKIKEIEENGGFYLDIDPYADYDLD